MVGNDISYTATLKNVDINGTLEDFELFELLIKRSLLSSFDFYITKNYLP